MLPCCEWEGSNRTSRKTTVNFKIHYILLHNFQRSAKFVLDS